MRKVIKIVIIGILILFTLCLSFFYFNTPNLGYVKKNQWRYESGFKIGNGDFVEFELVDGSFKIKKDTIFYKDKPRGIIVFTNEKTYVFVIKSIDNHKYGLYINTEGHNDGFW